MSRELGRRFVFPKIAYTSKRRINLPTLEVDFYHNSKGQYVFSVCGEIWNSRHTDCITCGQCLDTMDEIPELHHNPLFAKIYRLWKLYHLNDCHAGTELQESSVNEYRDVCRISHKHCDYDGICAYLKEKGCYIDNGYQYGSAWLWRAIPDEDLDIIGELLGADLSEFKAANAA